MRKLSICWAIVSILVCYINSSQIQPNECEPLRPLSGTPLQYKDRGNRCEGLYEADFGARALALISFTFGELNYSLVNGTKLELTVPNQTVAVHIRAIPKPSNIAYEMDAFLDAGKTLLWPVDEVLRPESLDARKMGIFAWKGTGANKVFVPVAVRESGSATSQTGSAILSIRPSFEVQVVKWRWALAKNDECDPPSKWADVGQGPFDAGQILKISLAHVSGPSCVDIEAQGSGTDWVPLNFKIELPRP